MNYVLERWDRYEGEWKNEGKGIYYNNIAYGTMGNYHDDKPIGKHARLTKNGEVIEMNY